MRVLTIMLKDLKQILQEKRSLVFLVAMPIVFTVFMGFAYGSGSGDANADARLPLAWVDLDNGSPMAETLHVKLDKLESIRVEAMDETAAVDALRKGVVAGVLVVPAGYNQGALSGSTAQLSLLVDPTSTSGSTLYQVLRQPVGQVMSSLQIAGLDTAALEAQGLLTAAERPAEFDAALQSALSRWDQTNNSARVQTQLAVANAAADPFGGNPYNQASPGILMMFAIMGLVNSAQILVNERKGGTLGRMLTTSLSPYAAVAGHFLAMFALTLGQQLMLVAFGQILLGVDYMRAPLGILAVMLALSMATGGMGLLIGAVAKEEQQVTLFSMIAMFTLSGLGGAWFPLEGAGQAYAAIGRLTPTAWAMTGFQNILIRGQGTASALLPAGILLAYAAVFYVLATWRLQKSM